MNKKIDKEAYQKRLDRMTEIFSDMVSHADELSQHRCPYRDRFDQCTAEFRCRNQAAPEADGALALCTHDGSFDYRTAWESDPSTYGRAKEKIEKIKRASSERRSAARKKPKH